MLPTESTLARNLRAFNSKPRLDPKKQTLDPKRTMLDPKKQTLDPKRTTLDPRKQTLDPKRTKLDLKKLLPSPKLKLTRLSNPLISHQHQNW